MSNKAVLPSLREKKRYLAFEIVSKIKIKDVSAVSEAVHSSVLHYLGDRGAAAAGVIMLKERFNHAAQRGIVRVNHKYLDMLKASLCFIKNIAGNEVIVQSIGSSGILKKAFNSYIAK